MWDLHRWNTESAFDNLADYLEIIEDQFESFRESGRKQISNTPPAGLSEEEYAEWQSENQFFEDRYDLDFPSKIRYSFVIMLHIIIENHLRAACNEISKRRSFEIRESDLRGTAIERAKTFLGKIAKLQIGDQTIWQWLNDFQKVRDCIVHANGQIELSRDKEYLNKLCSKDIGLSNNIGSLMIKRYYCTQTLEMAKSYFGHLFDSASFGKPILSVPTNK